MMAENQNMANPNETSPSPNEAVRNLQRYLRQISYVDPDIPAVGIDGIFDMATREALTAFQVKNGLAGTGVADITTWELLYGTYLDALFGSSEPEALPIFPISPIDYKSTKGDEGFLVSTIQYLLREISTVYDFPLEVRINGIFDEETERAVATVQGLFLLPITGTVDKRLWNYLVGAYRAEALAQEET